MEKIEKNVIILALNEGVKKNSTEKWYKVDYIRCENDGFSVKTDWVTALEFLAIKKKAKIPGLHTVLECQTGLFTVNSFDKLYLSDLK